MIPDYDEPDLRREQQLEDQRVAALLSQHALDPAATPLAERAASLEPEAQERLLTAAGLLAALRDG